MKCDCGGNFKKINKVHRDYSGLYGVRHWSNPHLKCEECGKRIAFKEGLMNKYLLFLLAVCLAGCASYQSINRLHIKAEKASYPLGLRMIHVVNGEITLERTMHTGGVNADY